MYKAMNRVTGQPIKTEIKSDLSKNPVEAMKQLFGSFKDAFSGDDKSVKEKVSALSTAFSEAFTPSSFKEQLVNADSSSGSMASTKNITDEKQKVDTAKTEKKQAQLTMIQQVQQLALAANEKVKAIAAKHAADTAGAENAAKSKKPTVLPTGNTHTKDLIAALNSGNNPLKVFN